MKETLYDQTWQSGRLHGVPTKWLLTLWSFGSKVAAKHHHSNKKTICRATVRLAVPVCASSPRLQVVSHWWHAQEQNVGYDLRSIRKSMWVTSWWVHGHPEASTCFFPEFFEKLPIIRLDPFSKVASLVQRSFIHREGFQYPFANEIRNVAWS